ncbi:hypothetical protein CspHIS471_0309340 [Cutaneotrichosporon sp. HIS471]|nr:hypothetical protein CspHIS471_0309340 [Cutaneotrichosporon sp. HIS471]
MAGLAPLDAQFHRAVDVVQSLPKSGPVQTSYEEKLQLYSLYKQATDGDNAAPRPGMLDMLGRAKWDSWAKQKGLSKRDAKALYVGALLKILQRFEDRDSDARAWTRELEAMGPLPRAQSPASSESSFHSSRASPPPDTSPTAYYPPPDPALPAPDVAPNIIPPSALTPSHRSLVNLPPTTYPYSDTGNAAPLAPSINSRPQSLFGGSVPDRDHLAALRARRQTAPVAGMGGLGYVPESPAGQSQPLPQQQQQPQPPSRPTSRQPYIPIAPPPFGPYVPQRFPSVPPGGNAPYARDFGTPDIPLAGMTGMPNLAGQSPYHPSPFARPTSASTFSGQPLNLPATLQQIHTSLQALHERLSTLERTQSALLRREERRDSRGWWPFSFSGEEEALDDAEIAAEPQTSEWEQYDENRRQWAPYSPHSHSTTIRLRKKKGLTARVAWALITAVRRAVIGVGAAVLVGSIALMFVTPRWRRTLQNALRRTRLRVARALADH